MAVLICRPVDTSELVRRAPHIPVPDPHKGSVIGKCESCNQEVWEGPEQRKLATQYAEEPGGTDHVILCILCGLDLIRILHARGDGVGVQSLTDKVVPMRYPDGTVTMTFPADRL